MKIAFFEIEGWEKEIVEKELKSHEVFYTKEALVPENAEKYQDFEIVSVFVHSILRKETLAKFKNLKMIATRSAGYDHIDIDFCKQNKIAVYRVPDYGAHVIAEHALALLLTAVKNIPQAIEKTRKGIFNYQGLRGYELKDKTIGIVGTGRIGKHMITFSKALGMNVVAYDAYPDEDFAKKYEFDYIDLEKLLSVSDIISLHVPLLPSTYHLINRKNLSLLKKGVIIINTARGEIIETEALIEGLEKGIISFACLDVIEKEREFAKFQKTLRAGEVLPDSTEYKTFLLNYYLFTHPRVFVTPHNAFNTHEAVRRIVQISVENILNFLKGDRTTLFVNIVETFAKH
ncbi:NAD(P)-dependent oxidoreductase [Thermodesulfatator atlanticus]|uniref:NAD(P)-dependent oxidoreductase n=1 Tax=Thermodesulfatator atlanticus TaxID=501497 RepID=UPI0003B49DD7|nr:NAD(P)-dependent oxidoreductase [Thermodesulfatator atlanticus]